MFDRAPFGFDSGVVSPSGSQYLNTICPFEGRVFWRGTGYSASLETGTINGGFKSDLPGIYTTPTTDGSRAKRVSTSLNGGGAPIRVITTNGGIKINEVNVAQ